MINLVYQMLKTQSGGNQDKKKQKWDENRDDNGRVQRSIFSIFYIKF